MDIATVYSAQLRADVDGRILLFMCTNRQQIRLTYRWVSVRKT